MSAEHYLGNTCIPGSPLAGLQHEQPSLGVVFIREWKEQEEKRGGFGELAKLLWLLITGEMIPGWNNPKAVESINVQRLISLLIKQY